MHIPGLLELTEREEIPKCMILLTGNSNVGKSCYSKEYLLEQFNDGAYCIYISCTETEEQFQNWLVSVGVSHNQIDSNLHFVNPYIRKKARDDVPLLPQIISEIKETSARGSDSSIGMEKELGHTENRLEKTKSNSTLIIDSLNHLIALFGPKEVESLVTDIYFTSKIQALSGICNLTIPSLGQEQFDRLSLSFDAILEMVFKDEIESRLRAMKMTLIKGVVFTPKWVDFEIAHDGSIRFLQKGSDFICYVCKSKISENPVPYSGLYFHVNHLEVYKRLVGIYGLSLSELGFSSEVMDASFFFIDIVGLSDPSFSVSSQRQKIEVLNNLIMSCSAYNLEEKKIILPTGDGMVIGFLVNPELSLKLGIQLHQKLRTYNRGKGERDKLKVRIGLSSGPVFSVSDIKNNQNFWGPGIILARRVMDIGGEGHILLSDSLAKALLALKDEYRSIIKYIGDYTIKHGQVLTLYSAYADDFGNPRAPEKR
ncbi:MAG TPA: ATPase domain-containing protein [Nitrososphaeraceae archaeon]|nr:ATPase domain-containing protein [Nitrososphaeraceae archaeon]